MIDHITYKDKLTTQQLAALADANNLEPGQFYFATNIDRALYAATNSLLIGPIHGNAAAFYQIQLLDDNAGLEDLWPGDNVPNPYFLQEVATDVTITVNDDADSLWPIGQVITFRQYNTGKLILNTSGAQEIDGPLTTNDKNDVIYLMRVMPEKWVSWLVPDPRLGIWTVNLVDEQDEDLYAPRDMVISSATAIVGSPTITVKVNDTAYTFNDAISQGDKITIEVTESSVINLKFKYD